MRKLTGRRLEVGDKPGVNAATLNNHYAAVSSDMSRGVRLAKNDFGFRFGFAKNCGFRFGFGFTKLTAVSVFGSVFWTVCCLMCLMLEMTYFCAELVQLIVSRSDSELEVQRYGMKKNMLTVDPIMLQEEL